MVYDDSHKAMQRVRMIEEEGMRRIRRIGKVESCRIGREREDGGDGEAKKDVERCRQRWGGGQQLRLAEAGKGSQVCTERRSLVSSLILRYLTTET